MYVRRVGPLPKLGRWRPARQARYTHYADYGQLGRVARLVAATTLVACGGDGAGRQAPSTAPDATTSIAALAVSADPSVIRVGETVTATAVALDARGTPVATPSPTWSSETPTVATVDGTGLVTAIAPGRSHISAIAGGKEGNFVLTVLDIAVAQVVLSVDTVRLNAGETQSLGVSLLDAKGAAIVGRSVAWSVDRPATATVSPAGIVTALASGVAVIRASSGGVTATATVIVAGDPEDALEILVTPDRATLVEGESLQLTAVLVDATGTVVETDSVSWVATGTTGTGVATVSSGGVVTALSPGSAIVEAISGSARGAAAIVVRKDIDESIVVTFAKPTSNEAVGDTLGVYLSVQSPLALDSVVASVARVSRSLVATPVGAMGTGIAWVGSLELSDLQYGTYLLTATAFDKSGATGLAAITVVRNRRSGSGGSKPPPRNK